MAAGKAAKLINVRLIGTKMTKNGRTQRKCPALEMSTLALEFFLLIFVSLQEATILKRIFVFQVYKAIP